MPKSALGICTESFKTHQRVTGQATEEKAGGVERQLNHSSWHKGDLWCEAGSHMSPHGRALGHSSRG